MKWEKQNEYCATRGNQTICKMKQGDDTVYGLFVGDKPIKYSRDKAMVFMMANELLKGEK